MAFLYRKSKFRADYRFSRYIPFKFTPKRKVTGESFERSLKELPNSYISSKLLKALQKQLGKVWCGQDLADVFDQLLCNPAMVTQSSWTTGSSKRAYKLDLPKF